MGREGREETSGEADGSAPYHCAPSDHLVCRGTSLIRNNTPQHPTVGLCLGPSGGPRGGGRPLPLRPLRSSGVCRRCRVSTRKVEIRLPGKGNSLSHGARPDHRIVLMIKWIRTSRLSIKNSPSAVSVLHPYNS